MADIQTLEDNIKAQFPDWIESTHIDFNQLTVIVKPEHLVDLCLMLRDKPEFDFKQLMDVCGVDYLHYGYDDWDTNSTTLTGFSRGVTGLHPVEATKAKRFAVVYHLLSLSLNHRIRIRVNIADEKELMVDSVIDLWPAADWFEREVFDLFGILFKNHPDLRRLLTDYGFVGHPFRKDFPLIGKVEARYDAKSKRVVYEPVSIPPRVLEPKVIRHDHRYKVEEVPDERKL